MKRRILALALSTTQDGVRSQIFVNLGVFAAFTVFLSLVLEQLAIGQQGRVLLDVGLGAVSVVDAMVAAFMTVRTMGGEEDRQALLMVLVRPVRRIEVLIGKFLGVTLLVSANALAALVLLGGASVASGAGVLHSLPLSFVGLVGEAALVTAATMLFATFSGSTVAAVLGLATYVVGLFAGELRGFATSDPASGLSPVVTFFYYAVPNLQRLDFHATGASPSEAALALAYVGLYAVAALALSAVIFEKRDLR